MSSAPYDGLAEWYDDFVHRRVPEFTAEVEQLVERLLGKGDGRLLDLGCGGGAFIPTATRLGWSVVGADASADQLRVARQRIGGLTEDLVHTDAMALPFGDSSFDAVLTVLTSTDIEPWEGLAKEAGRVLRPDGRFVHVGTHPCFVGPHAVPRKDDRTLLLGEGYRTRERQFDLPAFSPDGIRARVGAVHVPLDDLINAVISASLAIERVEEAGSGDAPPLFGLRARRL